MKKHTAKWAVAGAIGELGSPSRRDTGVFSWVVSDIAIVVVVSLTTIGVVSDTMRTTSDAYPPNVASTSLVGAEPVAVSGAGELVL